MPEDSARWNAGRSRVDPPRQHISKASMALCGSETPPQSILEAFQFQRMSATG
jgi:hypothetical protein